MGTGFRYRLERGERFAIEGKFTRTVRAAGLPTPLSAPFFAPWSMSARFVVDCVVDGVHDDGYTLIEVRVRELEVDSRAWSVPFRFAWPSPEPRIAQRLLTRAYRRAVGDTFAVKKNLAGHIAWAKGGERLRSVLGGTSLKSALTWFGALLSPHDGRWEETDRLPLGGLFFGLPTPANQRLLARYAYRPAGEDAYGGRRFPALAVDIDFCGDATLPGGLRVVSTGRGNGSNLVDVDRGKIARSMRAATLRLGLEEPRTGVPLGALQTSITSDAYHV